MRININGFNEKWYKDKGIIILILSGIILPIILVVIFGYMEYKDSKAPDNNGCDDMQVLKEYKRGF